MKWKIQTIWGISLAAGILLASAAGVQAADKAGNSEPAVAAESEDTGLRATLDRLRQKNQAADVSSAQPAKQEPDKKVKAKTEQDRFVELLNDNGFVYALDTKNARWIPMPHSGKEYIADVWVRLVQTTPDKEYSYPQKYYLEHYYIRPKTQQIQFLCELEVTGRPENAIQQRPYKSSNWEDLVPGSIEDEIFHTVLKNMRKNHIGGNSANGMSVRDVVEEYLRISL